MSISVECPSCSVPVKVAASAKLGQTVSCTACKSNLEVVWLAPIELDILFDDDDEDTDDGLYEDVSENPYEDYQYVDDADNYDRD
ncbi:MAG: hypothetical protein ISR58_19890 [Anaerolineales bacterium]|nr:hypothetical protein [Chloroflexota bacterium]MBL6983447.1 hypothetical protein [Anaerolineales bacterium]